MKRTILLAILCILCSIAFAQQKEAAEKLIEEGVAYYDKGQYQEALARYDKALQLDEDNLLALTKKAITLHRIGENEEAVLCCRKAIEAHSGDDGTALLYVLCGNAYDILQETEQSLKVYDEGIELFPDYFLLHFNKGISLVGIDKYDEAMECFQKSVLLNPEHAGSHNAIAFLQSEEEKRIPALLAYGRFFVIEPDSERSQKNLPAMKGLVQGRVKQTDKNTINITLNIDSDTTSDGKRIKKENDFSSVELFLSLDVALSYTEKYEKNKEIDNFIRNLNSLCSSLALNKKENSGFFWEYYAPYFIEMQDKGLLKTFAHLVFVTSGDKSVLKWIKAHKKDIIKFYEWSYAYTW